VESMCSSLMDQVNPSRLPLPPVELSLTGFESQGYIKAYIMHSKRLLVLQKGEASGFPRIASVNT